MRVNGCTVFALFSAAGLCGSLSAQVFTDTCGAAPAVAEGTYAFDLNGASNDFVGTCGNTTGAADQWILYVPSGNGTATVSTCGLTDNDTVLTVFNGDCGAPVLACNDDACGTNGLQSSISFAVASGNVYKIRIAGYQGARFAGQVAISRPNDHCSDATNVGNGVIAFSNVGADNDGGPTACGGLANSNDIWYRYYTPGPGVLTATTCDGATFDTVLSAHPACGGPSLACNDDACGLRSSIDVPMAANTAVLIRVQGYNGASGTGQLRFSFNSADSCANAVDVGDGIAPFNTNTAINDGDNSCAGINDIWFRYHSSGYGWLDATTCGLAGFDTVLGVSNACGGPTIACNDDACGLLSFVSVPVFPGEVKLVRVSGFLGSRGAGSVSFGLRSSDACANAYPVTAGTYSYDTGAATSDGAVACGQSANNVWYRYDSSALGRLTVTTCGLTGHDSVLTAFDGCGGPALACNDDAFCGGNNLQSTIAFTVQQGSSSYISLGGYQGLRGAGGVAFSFEPCRIDFNGDGFVDFFDYGDFVDCFETTICPPGRSADFNNDGFVDFFDYGDFVAAFEAGC